MTLQLIHTYGRHIDLCYQDQLLARYVYVPDTVPEEAPKPYFHPLHTLANNTVTLYRPHDHVWHTGLAMTMAELSGQNFWGGPTYVRDQGYTWLQNHGRIAHSAWEAITCTGQHATLHERLYWIAHNGEPWLGEERCITIAEIDAAAGYWTLDFVTRLQNIRAAPLVFGSPTTQGRPNAGYGSLFWRGPRSFTGGTILGSADVEGRDMMGKPSPWLAFIGKHDENGQSSTVLFLDHPANPHYPTKWFVRNEPYACVSCACTFDEELELAPDGILTLRYRVVIADGARTREQIETYAAAWQRAT